MLHVANDNKDYVNDDASSMYTSISIGNTNLLIQQSDIISITSSKDADYSSPSNNSVGWLYYDNIKMPLYSLNEHLAIERSITNNKNVCVVLNSSNSYISLLCNDAIEFKYNIEKIDTLPECMSAAGSPI